MGDTNNNFDFHSKNAFLTYPQCGDITHELALPLLAGLGDGRVSYAVVALEQHEDGGNHLHALICFKVNYGIRFVLAARSHEPLLLTECRDLLAKIQNQGRPIFRSGRRGTATTPKHPVPQRHHRNLPIRYKGGELCRDGRQTGPVSTSRGTAP